MHRSSTLLTSSLTVALFSSLPATAQNNDFCATPIVVTLGTTAFDTTPASTGTEGQSNPFCPPICNKDLWYQWVAPSTGNAMLQTCGHGGSMLDSLIAVYSATGCPAGPTPWCDDDACGLDSFVQWPAVAGSTYMLQIGGSGLSNFGTGSFTLSIAGPPTNDNCGTPIDLGTGGGASYDNTQASQGSDGGAPVGCTTVFRDLWYLWTAPMSGSATLDMCGQSVDDTAVAIWPANPCPGTGATPIACDDNGCGAQSVVTWNVVSGVQYRLQVGSAPTGSGTNGSFFILVTGGGSSGTPFCFGDGSGAACPCGNSGASGHGCANSIAATGAMVDAQGSVSISNDSLVLSGTGMPPNAAALYFQGTVKTNGGLGTAFGDGLRCVGGTIVRLGIKTNDGTGSSSFGGPVGDTPISVKGQIPAGGATREYQVWYRNAAAFCTPATFNLSNGIEVSWSP